MTDVVERDLKPWEPASGRRTALLAAGLLLALGAAALLIEASTLAGAAAAVVAAGLATGAIVLSRVQDEPETAIAVAWMGAAYAAVAGFVLVPAADGWFGLPTAGAGAGALLVGLTCLVGLGDGRTLAIPPVIVGAVALATGLMMRVEAFDPAVVLTTTLALVVLAGSVFPWLALGATSTTVDQLYSTADITAEPADIDPARVSADATVAHEILLAVTATVGVLLVLTAPFAVSLGVAGTLVAVVCCVALMLRTRQYRTGSEVLVGLVSGVAGLATTAVCVLWLHPQWRAVVAVVLAVAGAVLLTLTLVPSAPSVRRGRLGDIAETACLVALLPLLVIATGVFAAIRG